MAKPKIRHIAMITLDPERLAKFLVSVQAERSRLAAQQRAQYQARGFPEPGDDPGIESAVLEELKPWLSKPPSQEAMHRLVQRIRTLLFQENKRKNLAGEGFEDVLAFIIQRLPGASKLTVRARPLLHELTGFRPPRRNEKPRKVDLAVIGPNRRRVLASVKWSVRADREEQFGTDFEAYARLEDAGRDFDYVLITNEFDAARLSAACERRRQNASLFTSVVHVNPHGPLAAYGTELRGSATRMADHVRRGRLSSLENWLKTLTRH